MKKILIALMLLGAICANTFAQEYDVVDAGEEINFKHNEVYLAAGMPSFVSLYAGMFVAIFKGIGEATGGQSSSGSSSKNSAAFSITGGYNYYFNKYIGVGGYVNLDKFDDFTITSIQAKATVQYGWEHFKIYQALSSGIAMMSGAEKPTFIFDVTYLGLKLDFEQWNVFVDASIPSTGIIKAGASFKF